MKILYSKDTVPDIIYGAVLLFLAGFFQGTFAVFLRFAHSLRFGVYWLLYAIVGLFLCPLVAVLIAVPHVGNALFSLPTTALFFPCLFGVIWGISGMLLGKALEKIGMAGTYTITLGISVLSSVILVMLSTPLHAISRTIALLGICLGLAGIIIASYGRYQHNHTASKRGILYAVLSGLLTPAFSLGVSAGRPIAIAAIKFGASNPNAIFLLWFILLLSGFVVTLFYTLYEISSIPSDIWRHLTPRPVMGSILAGIFWFCAFALYSYAPQKLGDFGVRYGWALFIALSLVVAVFWGFITHEWNRKGFIPQAVGTISLLLSMFLIEVGFQK